MMNPLTETWLINHRINLYLLDSIAEEHLADTAAGGKGRTVGEQLAHLHNVRLMWLKATNPDLLEGLEKIEKVVITKALLQENLSKSADAIAKLLAPLAPGDKVKNFKPHALAFVGYLTAHEAHHRGQMMLCLKQSGHPADKKTAFGIWEWGVR